MMMMELVKLLMLGVLAALLLCGNTNVGAVDVTGFPPCNFPAIYNFGDSNSDTGNAQASQRAFRSTVRSTLFGYYDGRSPGGGRILLDFMAEKLRLPYVSAYLNSMGTNFQHGANFAFAGASIQPSARTNNLNNLDIQLVEFDQFKARTIDLYSQAKNTSRLPKVEDFSKALYTIDIGQNDMTNAYMKNLPDVPALIPQLVNSHSAAVKHLYEQGARTFWIHNTSPLGCYVDIDDRFILKNSTTVPRTKDQSGCYAFMEEMTREFNSQLKDRVNKLRVELPEAALTYVDFYTPMHELVTNHKNLGFAYIFGDLIHRNEAASHWLANRMLNGSFSDPPVPITHACMS